MAKRRIGIIALLLYLCLCLMPLTAQAASTADAVEPIAPDKSCALTLHYGCGEILLADVPVMLYRIAEVSADFQYTLVTPFKDTNLILNGIKSNSEWDSVRTTLESYIVAYNVEPLRTATTDNNGQAYFGDLKTGLYLAVTDPVHRSDGIYTFQTALIALPGLSENGLWQYEIAAAPKPSVLPPQPDEQTQYSVIKLWKGDDGKKTRPSAIEVDIFRSGKLFETVTLSGENNWSYSWTAPSDGAKWTVAEHNVPNGYTATLEERTNAFILTNTLTDHENPEPPKTGDTTNIMLYTVMFYISGGMLLLLGILGKRKVHEKQ